MTKVPICDIVTDRVLPTGTDIDDLVKKIRDTGEVDPILLCGDMTLIDGLRRVEAVKLIGWVSIDAIISDDIVYVLDVLSKTQSGIGLSPQRLYEFHVVLSILNKKRLNGFKDAGAWRLEDRPQDEEGFQFTDAVWRALGQRYRSAYGRAIRIYQAALSGDLAAKELIRSIERGNVSIETAAHAFEPKGRITGTVLDPKEQRQLLDAGVRSMATTITSVNKLGSPLQIPADDLEGYIGQILEVRRSLTLLVRGLKKEKERIKSEH